MGYLIAIAVTGLIAGWCLGMWHERAHWRQAVERLESKPKE